MSLATRAQSLIVIAIVWLVVRPAIHSQGRLAHKLHQAPQRSRHVHVVPPVDRNRRVLVSDGVNQRVRFARLGRR